MKHSFPAARIAVIATVFIGLFACRASASSDPIPGIDIIVKKKPGDHKHPISVSTNKDGTYEFKGLAPGKYDLLIGGHRVQTISVGADRSIGGVLSREDDGMASITFNGQAAALGPAAAIVTTRDNLRGKGLDKPKGKAGSRGVDDTFPDGNQRVVTDSNIKAMGTVSTTRGRVEKPGAPGGDTSLPGKVGDPIQGTSVGLEGDPDGARVGTTTTDKSGAFHFGKLPAGKYRLVITGQPDRLLNVGADGIASGKVMRGEGGNLRIFDRWGKTVAASKAENKKRAAGAENDDVLPGAPVNTTRSNKER